MKRTKPKAIACLAILLIACAGCDDDDPVVPPECGNGIREGGEECDDGDRDNGDGCSSTCRFDVSGDFDLVASLSPSPESCDLGTEVSVPITLAQFGSSATLTSGEIPGLNTVCARSDGTVLARRFVGTGVTLYPDFFDVDCDLVESDEWELVVDAFGDVLGTWTVEFVDDPAQCAKLGPKFPCTSGYAVSGSVCAAP